MDEHEIGGGAGTAGRRGNRVAAIVLAGVLLAVGIVLGYFCVQNANRYWEANHPPGDADLVTATVTRVDTEELCGQTSPTHHNCTTEVDGLDVVLADGSSHHVHAHAVFSPGEEVEAFQDGDGDWQVQGSFTKGWVLRTAGFTGLGAVALLGLAGGSLRPPRRTSAE